MPPDAILLIDDDVIIRQGIKTLLEEEGHQVQLAQTASAGIKKLKEGYFDLILLDYMLPDMNGIEAFRKIKEISQATPVILITGYGTKELAIEALKLDAFDFIEKPFHHEVLLHSIRRCLEMQRFLRGRNQEQKEYARFLNLSTGKGRKYKLKGGLYAAQVQLEKEMIVEALKMAKGNKSKAAELLGINRKVLYDKMAQYRISLRTVGRLEKGMISPPSSPLPQNEKEL